MGGLLRPALRLIPVQNGLKQGNSLTLILSNLLRHVKSSVNEEGVGIEWNISASSLC
jgi:hypothetical protein